MPQTLCLALAKRCRGIRTEAVDPARVKRIAFVDHIIDHRFYCACAALLLCIVGALLIPGIPTELLPALSERKFLITFLNNAGSPSENLTRLRPVIDQSLSAALGPFTYTAQADSEVSQFMITTSHQISDAERRIELAVANEIAHQPERPPFVVSEIGTARLPTAEVLILPKTKISDDQFKISAERLRDELQNSDSIGEVAVFGQKSAIVASRPTGSSGKSLSRWISENRRRNTTFQVFQPERASTLWWAPAANEAETLFWSHRSENDTVIQLDGMTAVGLALFRAPGASDLQVSADLNAILESFHSELIEARVIRDSSIYISQAEKNVSSNLLMGTLLTCLSILIFIRRLWSTVLVSLAIPVTLLLSIPVLHLLGVTRNVMSLAGVALGVGIVVDASLSTMHTFNERLQKGFLPTQAARYACRENQKPLLMTGLTTLAVFLPILTLSGQVGDLFSELSVTVIVGQVIGFVVSVYLTPALACLLHDKKETHLWIDKSISQSPAALNKELPSDNGHAASRSSSYVRALLERPSLCLVLNGLLIGIISLNIWKAPPSEFLPAAENSQYRVHVKLIGATDLQERMRLLKSIEGFMKSQGFTNRYATASPFEISVLADHEKMTDLRAANADLEATIFPLKGGIYRLNPLEPKSGQGEDVEFFTSPAERGLARQVYSELLKEDGVVTGSFTGDLKGLFAETDARMSPLYASWIPGSQENAFRKTYLDVIPLGFSARSLRGGNTQNGSQTSHILQFPTSEDGQDESESPGTSRRTISVLDQRDEPLVIGPTGSVMTRALLESDVFFEQKDAITYLIPSGFSDKVTLDIEGITSGEAEELISRAAAEAGLTFQWHPSTESSRKGFSELLACLAAAVAIIAILIFLQNWSLKVSLIVLCTFVWGPIGSIPGLILHKESLNASALVGFILLAGTIVNNGILLVEVIERKRRAQIDPIEACIQGIKERAVNVAITSLTTILGMLPMVFETGAGSQMYRGLAIVVVYGTLISTPISLIGVPSLIILFGSIRESVERLSLRLRIETLNALFRSEGHPR